MSAKKSPKGIKAKSPRGLSTKSARKTASRVAARPQPTTAPRAPTAPAAPPAEARAELADLVRSYVADALASELAARSAPTASPSSPSVSPSPFGSSGEKAVDQYTVRLTERERAVVELARTDRALWQSSTDLPPTVALRRLAWEGARLLGLLDRLSAPPSAQAATAA